MMFKQIIGKGDCVMILLPCITEWWTFALAAIKMGSVLCPSPVILTPSDLKYRSNQGKFNMIVTNMENVWKIEEIAKDCPGLKIKILTDCDLPRWINHQKEQICPEKASTKLTPLAHKFYGPWHKEYTDAVCNPCNRGFRGCGFPWKFGDLGNGGVCADFFCGELQDSGFKNGTEIDLRAGAGDIPCIFVYDYHGNSIQPNFCR